MIAREILFKFQFLQFVKTDQLLAIHFSFWNLGDMVQVNVHTFVSSYKIFSAESVLIILWNHTCHFTYIAIESDIDIL